MKKMLFYSLLLAASVWSLQAQEPQLTYDFGSFSESEAVVSCEFAFTNVGTAPLVIHQAISSCGCTVPDYTKTPIKPGERGAIKVTYNGKGKFPGQFRKVVTVRSNAKENKAVNLYIKGNMTPDEEQK